MIEFICIFKLVVNDMNTQHLEICTARKRLFQQYSNKMDLPIDLELWRCDKKIDWTASKQLIKPEARPGSEREEDSE